MLADLMHAWIDRQKYAVPEKYGNRYQLGKLIQKNGPSECAGNYSNRSDLASRLKWMSAGCQIWSLEALDLDPWGVCAPLGTLDAP